LDCKFKWAVSTARPIKSNVNKILNLGIRPTKFMGTLKQSQNVMDLSLSAQSMSAAPFKQTYVLDLPIE
jgi:hypothetical protein